MEQNIYRIVLYLLLLLTYINASEVKFAAYPQELKLNLTEAASMRCSVTDTQTGTRAATSTVDIEHISSIFITKNDGDDVASLTPYNGGMPLTDAGKLDVKGAITGLKSGEGYIELSWSDPAHLSLGMYQCAVTAVDARGHTVLLTRDLELTGVTPSILDVIVHMKDKEEKMKKIVDAQQQEIDNQRQLNTELSIKVNNQSAMLAQQSSEINNLRACSTPRVAFTSAMSGSVTVAINHNVIYDHVVYNEGSSYDRTTGLFTCSTAGVYSFTVNAMSDYKYDICLQLQLNSATIVAMQIYDQDWRDSASRTAVLHLDQGDVVRVWTTCSSELYSDNNSQNANSFTGVLIQPDSCSV